MLMMDISRPKKDKTITQTAAANQARFMYVVGCAAAVLFLKQGYP